MQTERPRTARSRPSVKRRRNSSWCWRIRNGIARHFDARHPVVLNLEGVTKDAALRLVDFLGGVAYAKGGELVRIAKNAFLLVPNTATVESTVLDEWDEIGKY